MERKRTGRVGIRVFALASILAAMLLVAAAPGAMATDLEDAQGIVDKARITFGGFMGDNKYQWMRDHLKDAKGVVIIRVCSRRDSSLAVRAAPASSWRGKARRGTGAIPAFYTMGSVSFGLQIGGESAEVVVLVMTQKGMDTLLTSKFKLGGDASVALGPVGGGAKGDITADFISFAKSKGLYAGLNLDGSYIDVRENLNTAYYGKAVTPVDIIDKKSVSNAAAVPLREELKKAK